MAEMLSLCFVDLKHQCSELFFWPHLLHTLCGFTVVVAAVSSMHTLLVCSSFCQTRARVYIYTVHTFITSVQACVNSCSTIKVFTLSGAQVKGTHQRPIFLAGPIQEYLHGCSHTDRLLVWHDIMAASSDYNTHHLVRSATS